jgi:hypothetical protein
MKVLFDFNNLAMRLIHLPMLHAASADPKWDMWKYMMFNNVYEFVSTEAVNLEDKRVDVILACDNKEGTWRSRIYPPYKGNRKKDEKINWDLVFTHLNMFLADVQTYLPWKVMQVPLCEADDIIACLCRNKAAGERYIVHSGDSDYLQLDGPEVDIFVPHKDEYVTFPCNVKIAGTSVFCNTAEEFLLLSVLTGQGCKDNVYNIKTPTDWAPTEEKKRKPPFGVKAAQKVIDAGLDTGLEKLGCKNNYLRNKTLIDFNEIPKEVADAVLASFNTYNFCDQPRVTEFLERYQWPSLMLRAEDISDVIHVIAGFDVPERQYFEDLEEGTQDFTEFVL